MPPRGRGEALRQAGRLPLELTGVPAIKAISGHTGLAAARGYLERDGRALARDLLHFSRMDESPRQAGLVEARFDWDVAMDETRRANGNDAPYRGRPARTYKHYVLSPDPRDGVSLADLGELAVRWAEESFPDFQVAIVYHDDNEGHVPHAHVIVNNTNLATGNRLRDPDPGPPERASAGDRAGHGTLALRGQDRRAAPGHAQARLEEELPAGPRRARGGGALVQGRVLLGRRHPVEGGRQRRHEMDERWLWACGCLAARGRPLRPRRRPVRPAGTLCLGVPNGPIDPRGGGRGPARRGGKGPCVDWRACREPRIHVARTCYGLAIVVPRTRRCIMRQFFFALGRITLAVLRGFPRVLWAVRVALRAVF